MPGKMPRKKIHAKKKVKKKNSCRRKQAIDPNHHSSQKERLRSLGLQSEIVSIQIISCVNKFYGCIDLRVIFQSTKSFFPYKDRLSRGQMANIV